MYVNNNGIKYLLNQDDYSVINSNISNLQNIITYGSYNGNDTNSRSITVGNGTLLILRQASSFKSQYWNLAALVVLFHNGESVEYDLSSFNLGRGKIKWQGDTLYISSYAHSNNDYSYYYNASGFRYEYIIFSYIT